jgi:hypothetical protein
LKAWDPRIDYFDPSCTQDEAARAFDHEALKYDWFPPDDLNFPPRARGSGSTPRAKKLRVVHKKVVARWVRLPAVSLPSRHWCGADDLVLHTKKAHHEGLMMNEVWEGLVRSAGVCVLGC